MSYETHFAQKGYTMREIRQDAKPAPREVPAHLRDRYSSYEAYQEALHEFLNGM